MDRSKLLTIRLKYESAYLAYKTCATRITDKTKGGGLPSAAELKAEEDALAVLSLARRILLDELTRLVKDRN